MTNEKWHRLFASIKKDEVRGVAEMAGVTIEELDALKDAMVHLVRAGMSTEKASEAIKKIIETKFPDK